jgi:hypothetical protein
MAGIIILSILAAIAVVAIASSVVSVARDGYRAVPTRTYPSR